MEETPLVFLVLEIPSVFLNATFWFEDVLE